MDVNWVTVIAVAPAWGVSAVGLVMYIGKGPVTFRRIDRDRAHKIVADEAREEQLAVIAPLAESLTRLVGKADLILAAVETNGGASLRDVANRIEKKLDDHIASSDKVEAAIYDQMAEQGHEIDALTRKVRDLFNKRGPEAARGAS